jgi:pimeloyl-ACP methyl ester carboxylesterase
MLRAMKWLRRIGLGLLALIALIVVTGAGYEALERRRAKRDFPPPGRLVDVGGRRMHLDCRGSGTPVVVLEAGLDINGSLAWATVHDSIAKTTRTCAYSRAGIMWSDPSEGPQNAATVAADLHETLTRAGEHPPLVMVGHSLGGPYVMAYTRRFGGDVAGLVFVDASHPDQMERFEAVLPEMPDDGMAMYRTAATLSWTGIVRVIARSVNVPNQPPDAVRAMAAYAPTSLPAMLEEQEGIDSTFADAGALRQLGDRPLVVLTAMAPLPDAALTQMKMTREKANEFQQLWKTLHDEEATWSTRSRHELVADATHYIQFDRPDVVIGAVRAVVDSVRARPTAAPATPPAP